MDIWHLERELRESLEEDRAALVGSLREMALQGKGSEILRGLMEEGAKVKQLERRKKIVGVMSYVRANLDWIANIPKLKGYGSGPVEKTVDIAVARRFKKQGMSWYSRNVNPLLRLRVLKPNGDWEVNWQERRKAFSPYAA